MPYEPLVLLHRLAPEDVDQLIRQNPPPLPTVIQSQNVQTFQNDKESGAQSSEKNTVTDSSVFDLENHHKLSQPSPTARVPNIDLDDIKRDNLDGKLQQGTLSEDECNENQLKNQCELSFDKNPNVSPHKRGDEFGKELVIVIDDCCKGMIIKDMVNSTAQHPKTRNPTNAAVTSNSNNNSTSENTTAPIRDPTLVKERITDETIMTMTSKSQLSTITPVIEVVDKKAKDVSLNNQHNIIAEENDSSGLSLRTRTISSTTVPSSLHQSIVSKASSVQLNCTTSAVVGSRPRGRRLRRKTLNGIANGKILKRSGIKKIVENKGCNSTSTVTKEESESSDLECLIQQQLPINPCNGTANYINKNDHSNKNVSLNDNTIKKHSVMLPTIYEDQECNIVLTNNKKSNSRKRKQSDIGEPVAEKRSLISDNSNDSLGAEKNLTTPSSLLNKSNVVVDIITFNFLKDNSNKSNQQYTGIRQLYSNCYGRTYWPTNWEYSAAALTSHIQKKMTKDTLRKIRLLCSVEANNKANNSVSSLKTNLNLKKSVIQRRGSANKLAALACAEMSSSSRHNTSTSFTNAKRRKGRPPGRKNKHLIGIVKSNSPRKSPRQHASTLAAIMSTKVINTDDKLETIQPKDIIGIDDPNINSGDMDGPCILPIAAPKHECKQGERRYRRRRRLDHQHGILERRRKRRSRTPSPPKLCAQQPAPQRNSINNTVVIDQEVVKLRTKHVDVVRRRARDERLRSAFVCQQLHQVNEIAERGRHDLLLNDEDNQDYQLFDNSLLLENCQNQIWSSQMDCSIQEPDNMCLQIMYEQTGDKKFLSTELTDETLQIYYQQRDLALAERMTNNCYGDTISSDLGADMLLGGNKRKKKRPNMTGWPKEKRRKTITTTNSSTVETHNDDPDIDMEIIARRRKAAEQQRLRRQRIKLEQQLAAKGNSKVKQAAASIPKRPGRRPAPKKKNVISTYRTTSVSSNVTTESSNTNSSTMTKRKNIKVRKVRKKRKYIRNKTEITISVPEATDEPQTVVKRRLGRPKGSIGHRKRIKLEMLKRSRSQTSSTDQQKENVVEPQTSTGKLKCVISTRNNRMKLLPSSSSSTFATSNKRRTATGTKIKKSSSAYNIPTSCLTSSPLSETIVGKSTRITAKKRRLQQQMTSATTWDVGRPKRYHSTNHGKSVSGVEEDCCFVGSQPFEQHCPGSGSGLSQNTVLENVENHQKENTVHGGL